MLNRVLLCGLLVGLQACSLGSQAGGLYVGRPRLPVTASITADELLAHARYLASPELGGRSADGPGLMAAARYIRDRFEAYGLAPGGDRGGFYQRFSVTTGVDVIKGTRLRIANGTK